MQYTDIALVFAFYIGDVNEAVVSHLEYVRDMCIVDDDETVPNCSSQWIAYSCGTLQKKTT